ncbi:MULTISPECIES: hypothetical protein [Nocardioides]|uniref:DUF222 domain-containing protein n=1 Tax=Nocardioides vastitatis TaxID=2568655 RepID=A0ABW0ZAG9_9ACTN|nr:hypothetical protein [Nocardioides sp.]THI95515.1 hypothetical protein E7Z54_18835 [Nocardioides sp.]
MTWTAFHTRGETLRSVITTADKRRDGILPMDVDGVAESFRDELDLLAALTLKWHTRLSGQIEQMTVHQPLDLRESVTIAWSNTAHELAGVRLILDNYRENPVDDAMAKAMAAATAKERHLLAVMSGLAGLRDEAAARVGAEIEEQARLLHRGIPVVTPESMEEPEPRASLFERLRAVVAA